MLARHLQALETWAAVGCSISERIVTVQTEHLAVSRLTSHNDQAQRRGLCASVAAACSARFLFR